MASFKDHPFLNPSSRWYYPLHWLVIIILGLGLYAQTFGFGFVFDDHFYILNTPYIRSFDAINQIWAILPKTRLVGIYSLALNYHLNQLDPRGYHIFNFVVHLLAVGLVWAFASVLFKIVRPGPFKSNKKQGKKIEVDRVYQELPFVIALLFLVHPCQTQAVSYISQRFESMATVFYLGSIYFYLCGRIASPSAQRIFLFTCSIGSAVLGIFTKEVAVTIPLMVLAAELILFNSSPFKDSGFRRNDKQLMTHLTAYYLLIIVLGIIFVLLFTRMVRTNFIDIYFHFSGASESHQGDIITGGKYALTQMRVFLTFLRVLIFPANQNVDYDYPLSTGLLHPPLTLAGLCLIGLFVFLTFKLCKNWPLISFGLAWVLISFSINTAPRANVIFEHKLYLISFGFFLSTVCALSSIIKDRRILIWFFVVLIAVLSLVSFERNKVWKNDFTLWDDAVRKSPHKARPYNSRGFFYGTHGFFTQALSDFDRAIAINPGYAEAYNNRGNTYLKQGDLSQAMPDLNKAISLRPNYAEAYTNRGNIYDKQGDLSQALSDYNKAIELNPHYPYPYNYRGIYYSRQGSLAQAMSDYNMAIALDPDYAESYVNRGTCFAQQGDFNLALSDYDKAIALNPDFAGAYYNRAVNYYQLKEYARAWEDVQEAESLGGEINPGFVNELKKHLLTGFPLSRE